MTMKKQILYILYSLCGMGILWFCTACTEQDELPAADLQPLAFTIGAPLPFQEMTASRIREQPCRGITATRYILP